ncbi:hypothetical protein ACTXT7_016914 [Hymenolepis weldensis]
MSSHPPTHLALPPPPTPSPRLPSPTRSPLNPTRFTTRPICPPPSSPCPPTLLKFQQFLRSSTRDSTTHKGNAFTSPLPS